MPKARVMFWVVTMSVSFSFEVLRETYPYDENGNVCPAEAIECSVSHGGLRCRRTVMEPSLRDWAIDCGGQSLLSLYHQALETREGEYRL
jgi:hypothetical protein